MRSRRGVGEVVGSVSMLAITVALLGGASVVAVLSIRQASALVQGSSQSEKKAAGTLVELMASQSNSSGTYLWLFDYGWSSAPISGVYVNGRGVSWTSSCPDEWSGSLCLVTLSPSLRGNVTVLVGGTSIAASV